MWPAFGFQSETVKFERNAKAIKYIENERENITVKCTVRHSATVTYFSFGLAIKMKIDPSAARGWLETRDIEKCKWVHLMCRDWINSKNLELGLKGTQKSAFSAHLKKSSNLNRNENRAQIQNEFSWWGLLYDRYMRIQENAL